MLPVRAYFSFKISKYLSEILIEYFPFVHESAINTFNRFWNSELWVLASAFLTYTTSNSLMRKTVENTICLSLAIIHLLIFLSPIYFKEYFASSLMVDFYDYHSLERSDC